MTKKYWSYNHKKIISLYDTNISSTSKIYSYSLDISDIIIDSMAKKLAFSTRTVDSAFNSNVILLDCITKTVLWESKRFRSERISFTVNEKLICVGYVYIISLTQYSSVLFSLLMWKQVLMVVILKLQEELRPFSRLFVLGRQGCGDNNPQWCPYIFHVCLFMC